MLAIIFLMLIGLVLWTFLSDGEASVGIGISLLVIFVWLLLAVLIGTTNAPSTEPVTVRTLTELNPEVELIPADRERALFTIRAGGRVQYILMRREGLPVKQKILFWTWPIKINGSASERWTIEPLAE